MMFVSFVCENKLAFVRVLVWVGYFPFPVISNKLKEFWFVL